MVNITISLLFVVAAAAIAPTLAIPLSRRSDITGSVFSRRSNMAVTPSRRENSEALLGRSSDDALVFTRDVPSHLVADPNALERAMKQQAKLRSEKLQNEQGPQNEQDPGLVYLNGFVL